MKILFIADAEIIAGTDLDIEDSDGILRIFDYMIREKYSDRQRKIEIYLSDNTIVRYVEQK